MSDFKVVKLLNPINVSNAFNDAEGDPTTVGTSPASDGTSVYAARRDHKHQIDTAELDARYVNVTGDTMTGALTITPTTDSTSIFNVTNSAGTSVLNVDTTNNRVGIGTTSPRGFLDIVSSVDSTVFTNNGQWYLYSQGTNTPFVILNNNDVRFFIRADGQLVWGATGSYDTNLFRESTDKLRTNDNFIVDQKLGIGTTNPLVKLQIGNDGNSDNDVRIYSDTPGAYFAILSRGNYGGLYHYGGKNLIVSSEGTGGRISFYTGGVSRMEIQNDGDVIVNSGNLGIGTTAPSTALEIAGPGDAAGNVIVRVSSANSKFSSFEFYDSTNSNLVGAFAAKGSTGELRFNATNPTNPHINFMINYAEKMVINSSGNIGISTTTPTAKLDVNSDVIRLRTAKTPASSTDTGNQGDICWDSNYLYVCVATNSWKRIPLQSF